MATDITSGGVGEPATHAVSITPDDSNDLAYVSRGVWVGGAGAMKVTMYGGETVLLSGITAGSLLPIRVSRIFSTDTTATLIVSFY